MCLAVPGRITAISRDVDMPLTMADVDFCGVHRRVCIDTVPDAAVGDYVIVHAGVAISVMDAEQARATLDDLETMTRFREQTYGPNPY